MIEIINAILQMTPAEWMLFLSSIVMLIGAIGLFRFPDIYTRTHAATLITVGGVCFSLFIILAQIFFAVFLNAYFLEILLIMIFIIVTSPVASQAIAEAAYKMKIKPITGRRKVTG